MRTATQAVVATLVGLRLDLPPLLSLAGTIRRSGGNSVAFCAVDVFGRCILIAIPPTSKRDATATIEAEALNDEQPLWSPWERGAGAVIAASDERFIVCAPESGAAWLVEL